jgi:WD40 repeat protein/tetratricopeptide (TPR) repeat protein
VTVSGTHAGDETVTLRGHADAIFGLAWSPSVDRLASASMDLTARVWDVASRRAVLGPLRHNHAITSVAWRPDGRRLATGSIDRSVKIWDATNGLEAVTLRGHASTVTSLSWGPGGRLASGGYDGSVRVWGSTRDQEAIVLPGHLARATSVSWSPDGKRLASGGDDGKVRIWDPATRKEDLILEGHDERRVSLTFGLIRSLAWSPDGVRLASAGLDGTARVWEVAAGREVFALPDDHGSVWSVAWSPDGARLAAGSDDGAIRVVEGIGHSPKVRDFKAHQGRARSLAWSPRGDRLASAGDDQLLKLWDPARGVELARMHEDLGSFLAVSWSPDGKRLASSGDRLVVAWDAETGRKLSTMRGHNDWVEGLAWNPDGERLASACNDGSVRVWDPRTGEEAFVLRGGPARFHDVSWTPDGAQLAAASSDGRVWIWDATRGFERDTTPRALPYLDRRVASGMARVEDRRWYAEFLVRAGKVHQALALLKDDPDGLGSLRPVQQAAARVNVGVAAFRQGRFADAAVALRQAGDQLQPLQSGLPGHPELARLRGMSLGFLGSTLRDLKRPGEALVRFRESLAAYEALDDPDPGDLYNMACDCAMVSALDDRGSPDDRETLQVRAVGYLRRAIEGDGAQFLPQVAADRDLDPLRGRADFRGLMADAAFPRDPFARPSPLPRPEAPPGPKIPEAEDGKILLARKDEGHALLAAGRTREGLSALASALAGGPEDTLLLLEVAALQAWFGQDAELALTCRRALESAGDTRDPIRADRTAKVCCLRPSDDKARLDATLALARQAVRLGKESRHLPYFQMALGMAEYRSGNDEAAEAAFLASVNSGRADPQVTGTSTFYRAMSLFRQGKEAEARRLATEAASRMRPLPGDENKPLVGGANADDLILWLAYREARALIAFETPPPPPPAPSSPRPERP